MAHAGAAVVEEDEVAKRSLYQSRARLFGVAGDGCYLAPSPFLSPSVEEDVKRNSGTPYADNPTAASSREAPPAGRQLVAACQPEGIDVAFQFGVAGPPLS